MFNFSYNLRIYLQFSINLTGDGYFNTSDVNHQDKEGNFYITDRVKELIKYKGFRVLPAGLEGLLASHSKISDVAVVGVYNEDQVTEVPRAYVVPAPGVKGGKKTEEEIMKWLAQKVASHKLLCDEVPKSASGKVLRRLLKAKIQEEKERGERAKL